MKTMDHAEARSLLLDDQRGRLAPDQHSDLRAHLDGCPACRALDAREASLTAALEESLPRYPASLALRRKLAARLGQEPAGAPRLLRAARRAAGPLAAAAAVALIAVPVLRQRDSGQRALVAETVSDHLRLLDGELRLQVVSSGIHEVKPWFAGRLDFAPDRLFAGDAELPLQGGTVAQFLDRKAAVLVYKRREHRLSLFVLRPEGLDWPAAGGRRSLRLHGFHVVLWRAGDLGYALASDLEAGELDRVADQLEAAR